MESEVAQFALQAPYGPSNVNIAKTTLVWRKWHEIPGKAGPRSVLATWKTSLHCLRNCQALIANRATENTTNASRLGHNADHGAVFRVTPRMIITM